MTKNNSIVLLSGGLDSSLAFCKAIEDSHVLYGLTFDYGQRSADKEALSAKNICAHFNVTHKVIALPFFENLTNHPLFQDQSLCPEIEMNDLDNRKITEKTAKAVWVPNRNGIFINVAASLSETVDVQDVYVGFNAEEAQTFPDNSKDFVHAINASLSFSTLNKVKIVAPTIQMVKKDIFKELISRDFPVRHLWSCYNRLEKMCGKCESCQRLKRAMGNNQKNELTKELFNL